MHYINERRPVRVEGRNRGKAFQCSHDVARKLIDRASFYAGKINYPQKDIKNIDGKHQPLIDMQTAMRIKERKAGRGIRTHYKQNEEQYPLKGSILCGECGKALTSSGKGSAGENKKHYMYYVCKQSGCSRRHKGIYVNTAHQNFSELLQPMQPDSLILEMAEVVMRGVWKEQIERLEVQRKEWAKEHQTLETEIDGFIDEMIGENRQTKNALKRRISEMEENREKVKALLDQKPLEESDFDRVLGNVFDVLANPQLAWEDGGLKRKRTIQRLVFPKNIFVKKDKNFRKPQKALLFRLTEQMSGENRSLVVD
ncbi:MAG: zinc ribbon domain-containing protein [Rickettsiales bacterium]|nr:zinc ribbon domain-containing protein [Rickettsiales bacterium]